MVDTLLPLRMSAIVSLSDQRGFAKAFKVNNTLHLNLPMYNALTMCDHALTQVARQLFIANFN